MKPRYLLVTILCLLSAGVFGQHARFAKSGIIEFEKSSNMHALIKKIIEGEDDQYYTMAFERYKKSQPQFKKLTSTLTFGNNKTLFVPQTVSSLLNSYFSDIPMSNQANTIFTD
ncbi:MAG: GLPGLI family protein, partial [Sphingobacteriaceae bacterium]